MTDIRTKISNIYSLEQLASGSTAIHRLHPMAKLLGCITYIVCVMSFERYSVFRLAPYVFYPVLLMALAEIPYGLILKRAAIALPFCLFAGISNLLFDRGTLFTVGGVAVSFGAVSFIMMIYRTYLCVSAVLILVSVTPFSQLSGALRSLHVPALFISLFEMTYRYIAALMEEVSSMLTAYHLRSGGGRGVEIRHMGSFIGQLLLRSFDRAERIYHAMQCRGQGLPNVSLQKRRFLAGDYVYLICVCGLPVLFRAVDVLEWIVR